MPVRASPVPSVVRGSFVVKFFLDSRLRRIAKSLSRCTMLDARWRWECFRREANTHRSSGFCRACAVRAGPGGGESERLAREGETESGYSARELALDTTRHTTGTPTGTPTPTQTQTQTYTHTLRSTQAPAWAGRREPDGVRWWGPTQPAPAMQRLVLSRRRRSLSKSVALLPVPGATSASLVARASPEGGAGQGG